MKLPCTAIAVLTLIHFAIAEPFPSIPLWPDGVPGEDHLELPEESVELRGEYQIEILSNVGKPTLTWYPAKEPNGSAVIVLPGGGYNILAISHEGTEVCEWLNSIGVAAGLLKYRVPRREGLEPHEAPLQDVQRSIGIARTNAVKWNIDPERLGVLGFSAGGNLAAHALTSDGTRDFQPDPKFDTPACVPNFGILIYPAYLVDPENPDILAPGLEVNETTPPVFMTVSDNDKKWVEGSARFYIEMHQNERPCELHVFTGGRHGFGFDKIDSPIKQWPMLAEQWLNELGLSTP